MTKLFQILNGLFPDVWKSNIIKSLLTYYNMSRNLTIKYKPQNKLPMKCTFNVNALIVCCMSYVNKSYCLSNYVA